MGPAFRIVHVLKIGENILEHEIRNVMNFDPKKFSVDRDAKNRLSLSVMVLEKKRQAFPSVKMKGT